MLLFVYKHGLNYKKRLYMKRLLFLVLILNCVAHNIDAAAHGAGAGAVHRQIKHWHSAIEDKAYQKYLKVSADPFSYEQWLKNNQALIDAILSNNIEAVKNLKDVDINAINTRNPREETALITAVSRAVRPEIVKILLQRGADVNAQDRLGMTALMMASRYGLSEIIKILLDNKADVNIRDKQRKTALIHASFFNNPTSVRLLLNHKAKITDADKEGTTPLMEAIKLNAIDIVKELLKQPGIEVNARNKKGETALMIANNLKLTSENPELIKLLLSDGATE